MDTLDLEYVHWGNKLQLGYTLLHDYIDVVIKTSPGILLFGIIGLTSVRLSANQSGGQ
jgi:hypothetical protein